MSAVTINLPVRFPCLRTDPFIDQLTVSYRPDQPVDLYDVFSARARAQMRDLVCGHGTVNIHIDRERGHLTISGCPVKIAHGVNAFPLTSNYHLVTTLFRELMESLSPLASKPVHLTLCKISRVDLTTMQDLGDPVTAQLLYDLLRLILRCLPYDDVDGSYLSQTVYDNSIVYGAYSDSYSVKLYRKSALLTSGLYPSQDSFIRVETTVSGDGAQELLQLDQLPSLEQILSNSRRLHEIITSGFRLMPMQLQRSRNTISPVQTHTAAYYAWLEHGFRPSLYSAHDVKAVVLAYRAAGLDLLQPPVPVRVSDRLRPALTTSLADLLDPSRVTLTGPGAPVREPVRAQAAPVYRGVRRHLTAGAVA